MENQSSDRAQRAEQPVSGGPRPAPSVGRPTDDEISLWEIANVLLKRRGTIVRSTIAVTLVAFAFALMSEKTFTASTSFMPQGLEGGGLSSLAGLAGQFGFQLPGQASGDSPDFYSELVRSREVLSVLATESFAFEVEGDDGLQVLEGRLPDLLEIGDEDDPWPERHDDTMEWLREKAISVSVGRETGIVSASIKTSWAGLSTKLMERVLELVNEFNLETRQTQAAAEREFVEARLSEIQDSLRAAEDRLEDFLEANRLWQSSPELTFQQGRLLRQVTMQQQVYTTLAQAHEQARIAEVRNTPVITVIERPVVPVKPDRRRLLLKLILGMMLGAMLGVFLAFVQEAMQRGQEEGSDEYLQFSSLWDQTLGDLRSAGGLFRRTSRGGTG